MSGTLLKVPLGANDGSAPPDAVAADFEWKPGPLPGAVARMPFMQRVAWILVLLAAAAPAVSGAELFRCIDAAGGVTWQDAPCGAGSRLSKTLAVPEAANEADGPSGASSRTKGAKSKRGESSGSSSRRASATSDSGRPGAAKRDGRSRQRESCKAARAERDRKLEALGLTRTFEQLRAMDDKVRAVCKDL